MIDPSMGERLNAKGEHVVRDGTYAPSVKALRSFSKLI